MACIRLGLLPAGIHTLWLLAASVAEAKPREVHVSMHISAQVAGRRLSDRGSLAYPSLANGPATGMCKASMCYMNVSSSMEEISAVRVCMFEDDDGVALDRPIGGCDVAVRLSVLVRS